MNHSYTYKSTIVANNNYDWRDQIEQTPGVICFNQDTLPYLDRVLKRFHSEDPYLTCPAYHAFTGRYGLWGYSRDNAFLLFARHPNQKNTIIIFPQFGQQHPNLVIELIQQINLPHFDFLLVRYPSEQTEFAAASFNKKIKSGFFKPKTEDVLDWAYPVQTLSTKEVVEAKGKHFKNFRNLLHRIDENEIRTELIDPFKDYRELKDLVKTWVLNKKELENKNEVVEGYTHFLNLMKIPSLKLSGLKFYKNENLVAFEIWALPAGDKTIASNLAGLNTNVVNNLSGFSAYQHYIVCRTLLNQGIEYVCIGGSETKELDRFKRKMKPIHSMQLKSIAVENIYQDMGRLTSRRISSSRK